MPRNGEPLHNDSSLSRRTLDAIARHRMFRAGDRVGLAVSGGADSVALLCLLDDLRATLGINLAVLHFNHQLRGAESDADEQFVAALAAGRRLELFAAREDVRAAARAHHWNLEDAARRLRYAFFSSVVTSGQAACVAVAHTADDQAETVLARLLRGTAPAGLAAIYPVKGHIVRPLLGVRRHELRAELARRGQSWREDSSNQDATRLPAKLRHQILPVLERDLHPGVVAHLGRLAEMAREDEAFWTALTAERLQALALWEQPQQTQQESDRKPERKPERQTGQETQHQTADRAAQETGHQVAHQGQHSAGAYRSHAGANFDTPLPPRRGIRCADLLSPLASMPMQTARSQEIRLALARRLVRGIIRDVQGHCQELTSRHLEQVLELATTNSSGHRAQLPGILVERSFDWLWFAKAPGPHGSYDPPDPYEDSHEAPRRESALGAGAGNCASREESGNAQAFSRVITMGFAGDSAVVVISEIGRCFRLKVVDWPVLESETITVLDRDLLRPPLVLRNWQPGDSFRPQGRGSVHKLKYFFRTHRIEARDRAGWPVLTSDGAVVWTRGMPVAAEFAPGPSTRAGVVLVEERM